MMYFQDEERLHETNHVSISRSWDRRDMNLLH